MSRSLTALVAALGLSASLLGAGVQAGAANAIATKAAVHWVPTHAHAMPRRGAPQAAATGATSPNPFCSPCFPPLIFHGASPVAGGVSNTSGPVGAVTIFPIFWQPPGFFYTPNYKSIINGYLSSLQTDSGKASNVFATDNEYYQTYNGTTQAIRYSITAGPEIDDISATRFTGCTIAFAGDTACVSDANLANELIALTNPGLPTDDSHIYMVMFPNHVETCMSGSSAGYCSTNAYCAYHSGLYGGGTNFILYGNEPFPNLNACTGAWGAQAPNGDSEADTVINSFSHEVNETITDAFGAWYDRNGFENGDECAYTFGNALGGSLGTYYNQVIAGNHYWTQMEWSNQDFALGQGDPVGPSIGTLVPGCRQREELPTAAFNAPGGVVQNVAQPFDGSGSSDPDNSTPLSYSWNWGDGSGTSSGATPSHTYAACGTFSVALTVTDGNGWTGSVSHPLQVATGGSHDCVAQSGGNSPGGRGLPIPSPTNSPGTRGPAPGLPLNTGPTQSLAPAGTGSSATGASNATLTQAAAAPTGSGATRSLAATTPVAGSAPSNPSGGRPITAGSPARSATAQPSRPWPVTAWAAITMAIRRLVASI
jgi:PKD repeat protein